MKPKKTDNEFEIYPEFLVELELLGFNCNEGFFLDTSTKLKSKTYVFQKDDLRCEVKIVSNGISIVSYIRASNLLYKSRTFTPKDGVSLLRWSSEILQQFSEFSRTSEYFSKRKKKERDEILDSTAIEITWKERKQELKEIRKTINDNWKDIIVSNNGNLLPKYLIEFFNKNNITYVYSKNERVLSYYKGQYRVDHDFIDMRYALNIDLVLNSSKIILNISKDDKLVYSGKLPSKKIFKKLLVLLDLKPHSHPEMNYENDPLIYEDNE